MDVMIMMPLSDLFMQKFAITPGEFSLLLSSYGIAAFFSSLCGVFLLDKFDRRNSLIFIYSGFVVGTFLCGLAPNYMSLLVIRFITGLFGGIIGALALSIVSDVFVYKERGQAIGTLMAAFSAAAALGVPAGFYLATEFGWRFPFFIIAGIGSVILVTVYYKFPNIEINTEDRIEYSPYELLQRIFGDKNIVRALVLGFVVVFGHFLIIPFITPFMTRNVGFELQQVTYIYLVGGVLTVFSAPFIGKMADKYGVIPVFFILMVLSFIPVVWLTNMGPTAVSSALIVTSLFFVLGSGRMIPPQSLITSAVGPDLRGSFMSLKSAFQQLSIAGASAVGGFIVAFDEKDKVVNYEIVGYLSVGICILSMVLAPKIKVVKGN
jgi:predicted MFS family arabinose efflux permease